MRDQLTRSRGFSRRAVVLAGGKLALVTVLTARLYYLQFFKSEEYKTLSDGNRIRMRPVIPFRGLILDREGIPMAENKFQFRMIMDPENMKKRKEKLERIAKVIPIGTEEYQQMLQKIAKHRGPQPIVLKEHLTWEEVSLLELNTPDLSGVEVESADIRSYPLGPMASHLIGYTGIPSKKDVERNPLFTQAEFKVGKSGMERELEDTLRGKIGIKRMEVNAHGQSVRQLSIEESTPGKNVHLTIDARLQQFTAERISKEGGVLESGGAVVVMDIRNGDILTFASTPGYQPNEFSKGISSAQWQALMNHPDKPLINKAIGTQYPPGSTFKIITALAGLESGTITPATSFYCPGYYQLGNRKFHCWNEDGHGTVQLRTAIAQSCNVFFFNVARAMGVDKIAEMADRFGLGKLVNIGLPEEKPGLIPSTAWKRKTYGKDWMTGESLNTGIGQGYTLVTPLQLATMIARYASGGKKVMPRLVRPEDETAPPQFETIEGVTQEHLQSILEAMNVGINEPFGTAFAGRILDPQFAMAGKTGTAQVRSVRGMDDKVERKYRNHALFVAFAPVHAPRYAISVLIEHGYSGGRTAVPVARDVLMEAQRLAVGAKYEEPQQPEQAT